MLGTISIHFAATLLLFLFYVVEYFAFEVCFADDVEFQHGKKGIRKHRKNQKGLWNKILFLDIRKNVVTWHYIMFWINLFFSSAAILLLNLLIGVKSESVRIAFLVSFGIEVLTTGIIAFTRWSLYAGNKIRKRK